MFIGGIVDDTLARISHLTPVRGDADQQRLKDEIIIKMVMVPLNKLIRNIHIINIIRYIFASTILWGLFFSLFAVVASLAGLRVDIKEGIGWYILTSFAISLAVYRYYIFGIIVSKYIVIVVSKINKEYLLMHELWMDVVKRLDADRALESKIISEIFNIDNS